MEEETKRFLDAMESRFTARISEYSERVEARFTARTNDNSERISYRLASLERDFENTKSFLVGDALVASRRWLDLETRVTKLENKNG